MRVKTAVFGGSFNPVHTGHIRIAACAVHELGYQKVLFIPASTPPHKQRIIDVEDSHRIAMLKIALKGYTWATVDLCEIQRAGISYSIDTLRYLKQRDAATMKGKPGFILGDDLLEGFSRWREPEALSLEADLVVAHRQFDEEREFSYPHSYLHNPHFPHSSTEVRESIQAGRKDSELIPKGVADYIREHSLYGSI